MLKSKLNKLLFASAVVAVSAQAQTLIISDNFDLGATNTDLNTDLGTRQLGNLAGVFTYSEAPTTTSEIFNNALSVRLTQTVTTSDLASSIADESYTISVDLGHQDPNGNNAANEHYWITLGSSTGFQDATAPLQIGVDVSNSQFYVGVGDGVSFTTLGTASYTGTSSGTTTPFNLTFEIEEGATDIISSVTFDGNTITLSDSVISNFGSTRELSFGATGSGMRGRFDNLNVTVAIPELSTTALFAGALAIGFVALRRRKK